MRALMPATVSLRMDMPSVSTWLANSPTRSRACGCWETSRAILPFTTRRSSRLNGTVGVAVTGAEAGVDVLDSSGIGSRLLRRCCRLQPFQIFRIGYDFLEHGIEGVVTVQFAKE